MENYIGKICPFCKTEITAADAIIVCPACGIPHHAGCWEENHGCTTFGCSQQRYQAQHTSPTAVCTNCGTPLGDGQAFCPRCGTPKAAAPRRNICGKCGNELQEGQEFCPRCGQRAGLALDSGVSSAINQFNAGVSKANEAKKKKPLIALIVALAAVMTIVLGVLVAPALFVTVDSLCREGNYIEAYERAEPAQKDGILAENLVAVLCSRAKNDLKDPSSFRLKEAYHYGFIHTDGKIGSYIILYASGKNSYGNEVNYYWAYTLAKSGEWNFVGTTDVTYKETGDDVDEMLTKIVVSGGIEKGKALSSTQINRVNSLIEKNILYKVVQIDWDVVDTSNFRQD